MTTDQLTTADQSESSPDHEPVRPRFTLTEAARLTGTSRSTIKRRLAAGDFPNATKDDDGAWQFAPGDLLAAGLKLRTPANGTRDDDDQADDAELLDRIADLERQLDRERLRVEQAELRREHAELIAAERQKRADLAERALLMLEAAPRPVPLPQPAPAVPAATESAARMTVDSAGGPDQPAPGFWRRLFGQGAS